MPFLFIFFLHKDVFDHGKYVTVIGSVKIDLTKKKVIAGNGVR